MDKYSGRMLHITSDHRCNKISKAIIFPDKQAARKSYNNIKQCFKDMPYFHEDKDKKHFVWSETEERTSSFYVTLGPEFTFYVSERPLRCYLEE